MPSESGAGWSPPASNSERRLSNSSDGSAGSGYSRALSTDSADFLATRPHTASVLPGRPAGNPLQFVRVGPADLGKSAREQLRKAELAQRTERVRTDHQEDWQSNLDNWKSSRRKRVEHIIERCVEVKRMENEPCQPRAKSKTFNEMMEERAGRRRRVPLPLYADDDGHDLSDLGIGTSSTKSSLSEDCDAHSLASDGMDLDKNHSDVDNMSNCEMVNRKLGSSANEYDTCTTTTISSPEPEEYTYEGAIEGYKSRIISQTNSNIVKTAVDDNRNKETSPENVSNGDLNRIRTNVSNKFEEKVSSFQNDRLNDFKNNNQKKDLPKVDILKRREQFQRDNSQELQPNKPKLPDIANKKSIKERLSSLEKFTEESQVQKSTNDLSKLPSDVKPLKERLSSLEKFKSESEKAKRLTNGDLNNAISVKERLSSLKSQTSEEEIKITKTEVKEVSMSLKERLFYLDAAKNKDVQKVVEDEIVTKTEAKEHYHNDELTLNERSLNSNLSGIETQMESFCRSLDSLDINGQTSPSSFERVQSLEDFDCSEIQNTVPSDIETEDSGIHTARDSCVPADDIADLTQVTSPLGEHMSEVSEYESSNEDSNAAFETKLEEPVSKIVMTEPTIEEIDEQELSKTEDTDSASNYLQATSQPIEELSATDEITEIQMDKDDEDTLKSLENQDTSVSLNEPISSTSDGENMVFEGKMTIHLNLNEICNNANAGFGNNSNSNGSSSTNDSTNRNSMPMVIDALELAFQEIDSENSNDATALDVDASDEPKSNMASSGGDEAAKVSNKSEVGESKKMSVAPSYENIDIFYQNGGAEDGSAFPLDLPTNVLEPPKEKPPPPPVDDEPDNEELLRNAASSQLHTRGNSARRIKREIRDKRTSFLGIAGVDGSYLDAGLAGLAARPDITPFLRQETEMERLLYQKTRDRDADAGWRESRDSGVDVWHSRQSGSENSGSHSRQNSEPHTQVTVTSDEEEQAKATSQQFTTNLTSKLEHLQTETSASSASDPGPGDTQIEDLDKKIQQQQSCAGTNEDWPDGLFDDAHTKEVLRFERELLQLEQEELRRQREKLRESQTRLMQKSVQDVTSIPNLVEKPPTVRHKQNQSYRHSMPNLLANEHYVPTATVHIDRTNYTTEDNLKRKPVVSEEHMQRHFGIEESRKILYEDEIKQNGGGWRQNGDCHKQNGDVMKPYESVEKRQFVQGAQPIRPPQPVPPKPRSRESIEREITMRCSRVPSAGEYANAERGGGVQRRPQSTQHHAMTRHSLQVLSAAPTPKLISTAEWMQTRNRKPATYNYNQHWLIQEAEQRRLEELRDKQRLLIPHQRHSYHHDSTAALPIAHRAAHLSASHQHLGPPAPSPVAPHPAPPLPAAPPTPEPPRDHDKMLSVSGKKKCSHCGEELGRGAAMIIESLSLCYHVWCFTCAVCGARLGDGLRGADVRVRGRRLHCHHCYSGDDGRKYSCV